MAKAAPKLTPKQWQNIYSEALVRLAKYLTRSHGCICAEEDQQQVDEGEEESEEDVYSNAEV